MSYPIENEKVTNVRIDGLNKRGGGGGELFFKNLTKMD